MSRSLVSVLTLALVSAGFMIAAQEDAAAKVAKRSSRTVVTIAKPYSAGNKLALHERRAVVPEADARFRSTASNASGSQSGWTNDPFYLPNPGARISVDFGALSSKAR